MSDLALNGGKEQVALVQSKQYSLNDVIQIANLFAESGLFKDSKTKAAAFAKILAGQEIGIGPLASMSQLHFFEGKATMDATLVGAKIKQSGRYDYRIKTSTDDLCTIEFFDRSESLGFSSFSKDNATRAGLLSKTVWKAYPQDMMRSRAMTRGARMYCPEVFNGAVYTSEELNADVSVNADGQTVVNVTPALQAPPTTTAAPQIANPEEMKKALDAIFSTMGLSVNNKDHRILVMTQISDFANFDRPATRWSDFTLDDLTDFAFALHQKPVEKSASEVLEEVKMLDDELPL